jgi:hypothetical protein
LQKIHSHQLFQVGNKKIITADPFFARNSLIQIAEIFSSVSVGLDRVKSLEAIPIHDFIMACLRWMILERIEMSQLSNTNHLPLDQCLENLRAAGLLVAQHQDVSEELKSFLGELIEVIVDKACQTNSSADEIPVGGEDQLFAGLSNTGLPRMVLRGQGDNPSLTLFEVGDPPAQSRPYQLDVAPQSGAILVTHLDSGRTLTCSAHELISMVSHQGLDKE